MDDIRALKWYENKIGKKAAKELIEPMLRDKKRGGNRINLIIPREIGHCDIVPMELENLAQFMKTE